MATSTSERSLSLTTDNPQAEILLIDGGFRVVTRGPSPLVHTAAPGLYAMKVKVGDQENETILVVEPGDKTFAKYLAAPDFDSPIPLGRTSTKHEYHMNLASRLLQAGGVGVTLGHGTEVMVCVRDPSKTNDAAADPSTSEADRAAYAASFEGFRILNRNGQCIVDLDEKAERSITDGYLALTVELNPGWYALAYRSGSTWICSPLPLASDWTLQVYINIVRSGRGRFALAPDLSGMATVFGHMASGFSPWRSEWIVGETVRQGLLEGRNYVDTPSMRSMLTGKFDDPMLGLYGAHLLLVEPKPDLSLIEEVVQNLGGLLGTGHPDVVALICEYERLAGKDKAPGRGAVLAEQIRALAGPPLLARSWDLLLQASSRHGVSLDSAPGLFKVAPDLVPNGVFLAWQRRSLEPGSTVPVLVPYTLPAPNDGPLPLATPARGATPKAADGLAGMIGAIATATGPLLAATVKLLKFARRVRITPEEPNIAAQIAKIDNNEMAAAALAELARRHDWRKLLPDLHRDAKWVSHLSGLQRDLVMLLRDASDDPLAIEGLTADFVEQMLRTHRVSLPVLAKALADIELSGWLGSGLREGASRATTPSAAERSGPP